MGNERNQIPIFSKKNGRKKIRQTAGIDPRRFQSRTSTPLILNHTTTNVFYEEQFAVKNNFFPRRV